MQASPTWYHPPTQCDFLCNSHFSWLFILLPSGSESKMHLWPNFFPTLASFSLCPYEKCLRFGERSLIMPWKHKMIQLRAIWLRASHEEKSRRVFVVLHKLWNNQISICFQLWFWVFRFFHFLTVISRVFCNSGAGYSDVLTLVQSIQLLTLTYHTIFRFFLQLWCKGIQVAD